MAKSERYCTKEQSDRLRELGFIWPTNRCFCDTTGEDFHFDTPKPYNLPKYDGKTWTQIPTQQMALDWFDIKGVFIEICAFVNGTQGFGFQVKKKNTMNIFTNFKIYDSRGEATDAAISYVLNNKMLENDEQQ